MLGEAPLLRASCPATDADSALMCTTVWQLLLLPDASVAVHVMVLVPVLNNPEAFTPEPERLVAPNFAGQAFDLGLQSFDHRQSIAQDSFRQLGYLQPYTQQSL